MRALLVLVVALTLVSGCEKPTAKFHPGQRVRVKLTGAEGVIISRISPFVDDLYYLKVPVGSNALDYTSEADRMNDLRQENVYQDTNETRTLLDRPDKQWHFEGPYYDTDLQVVK